MQLIAPQFHRLSFVIQCQQMIVALVVILNDGRSPITILRQIPLFIISTLQGKSGRAFAHICKEVGKFIPPFAYLNASPSIVFIVNSIRIVATCFHGHPYMICRTMEHSVGLIVRLIARATTTGCSAPSQFACKRVSQLSAFAFTQPCGAVVLNSSHKAQYGKLAKHSVGQVYKPCISWLRQEFNAIFNVGHDVYSLLVNGLARLSGLFQRTCEPFSLYHFTRKVNNAI